MVTSDIRRVKMLVVLLLGQQGHEVVIRRRVCHRRHLDSVGKGTLGELVRIRRKMVRLIVALVSTRV